MGSGQFADVVLAAYMLYCIYDDFRGTVGYTGSIDEEWLCGWIKHLIGDELPVSFAIGKGTMGNFSKMPIFVLFPFQTEIRRFF